MLIRTICILYVVIHIYVLIGGAVFFFLEKKQEDELKDATRRAHLDFLDNNTCISSEELDVFLKRVLSAYDRGVVSTGNFSSMSNWDLSSAVFFATTVVTTIGYGNIAPSTMWGQCFCVPFALVGIPLCTALLASIGQRMREPVRKLQQKIVDSKVEAVKKCIKLMLCAVGGILVFIILPSLVFSAIEGWQYGSSVYFCVITLTTIGFGDYVPGRQPTKYREVYRMLGGFWVLFGLAWVALVIGESVGDLTTKINTKERQCTERCKHKEALVPEEVEMSLTEDKAAIEEDVKA